MGPAISDGMSAAWPPGRNARNKIASPRPNANLHIIKELRRNSCFPKLGVVLTGLLSVLDLKLLSSQYVCFS